MSIDIASLASAVGGAASAVAAAGAAAELTRRARRIEIGRVSIERLGDRPEKKPVEIDWRVYAGEAVAALDDVSATEYALDRPTRKRIDDQIDRAIKGLERQLG